MTKPRIAICYDFDGTLSPGNMQEYDFMKKIGMDKADFWRASGEIMQKHNADSVLSYMRLMIEKAAQKGVSFTRQGFRDYGRSIALYKGVSTWFKRINAYGASKGVKVEHYIISSGIREMILGNPIAKHFKHIYASSFMYDEKGNAVWPAVALNYTTKTQYLFRINKGCFNINDPEINAFVPDDARYIPLSQMVYIGDGSTDVPCMVLTKRQKGHSIAVYNSQSEKSQQAAVQLAKDNRVDFISLADYSKGSKMEKIMKAIIDKIVSDIHLENMKKENLTLKEQKE